MKKEIFLAQMVVNSPLNASGESKIFKKKNKFLKRFISFYENKIAYILTISLLTILCKEVYIGLYPMIHPYLTR